MNNNLRNNIDSFINGLLIGGIFFGFVFFLLGVIICTYELYNIPNGLKTDRMIFDSMGIWWTLSIYNFFGALISIPLRLIFNQFNK